MVNRNWSRAGGRTTVTCVPPLPPGVYFSRPMARLPFPGDVDGVRLFAFARQGLYQGVLALGLGEDDDVLVPAYHHGSEVEALRRAGLGLVFYGRASALVPDEDELASLLTPRVRALHIIHYFGFPQEAARWRRWCDRHGLLLIEDAAQAWLATEHGVAVGVRADLAVFCLYKTLALPDGAFAVSTAELPVPAANRSPGLSGLLRKHMAWAAQHSAVASTLAARVAADRPYEVARNLSLEHLDGAPGSTTAPLLRRLAAASGEVAKSRRTNYALLLRHLHGRVPDPMRVLPPGAVPFVFPVVSDDKPRELARLRSEGVTALDLWSVPHPAVPPGEFPEADRLRSSLIGLPVHQHLPYHQVLRVARAAGVRDACALSVDTMPDLESVRPAWQELAKVCPNPFATFEWAEAWLRHHADDGPLLFGLCTDHRGRPAAVLPLQRVTMFGLRTIRFIGADAADVQGPVCSPADNVLAAEALRSLLSRTRGWDVWLGDRLPGDTSWAPTLGARLLRQEPSPSVVLSPGGWEAFLSRKSANFRQQVRRRERALFRDHDAAFRLSDASRLHADMDALFSLHAQRWGAETPFLGECDFHRDFASAAQQRGWLRLWLLEVDGGPVAAWYGFRYGRQEWYYQAGRDPAWDRVGVGGVLLAHTIRAAADDGVEVYRLLRGGEQYKTHYATRDDATVGVASARGPLGAAAVAAAAALLRLPPAPRARVRLLVDQARARLS